MKRATILLAGLAGLCDTPAQAAAECWNFEFRASGFRDVNPPQQAVTGSFTLTIDWGVPTGGTALPHPDDVDVTVAGHSYAPAELKWTYSLGNETLIVQPEDPLEDKELFVTAGQNQFFLIVDRPRTIASPAAFVYSVKGASKKWVTSNVAVSARKCGMRHGPNVIQKFRRPTYILCDIGRDLIRGPRLRPVRLRNRGRRVLPTGTVLAYSTGSGAVETIRLQRPLVPGAAVLGRPTPSRTCRIEVVAPARW